MINLLPEKTQQQLRAAHANTILLKSLVWLFTAIAFLFLACSVSYMFLVDAQTEKQNLASNSQSVSSLYAVAEAKLNTINKNIATAKTLLFQQISYSEVITNIAGLMPTGTVLDRLVLGGNTGANSTTSIKARAKSEEIAAKMKDNFQKSSSFSNYSQTTSTNSGSDAATFPILINISLTINKGVSL